MTEQIFNKPSEMAAAGRQSNSGFDHERHHSVLDNFYKER
jgi:hypothetical protein